MSTDTMANTSGEEDATQQSILPDTLSVLFVYDDAILRKLFVYARYARFGPTGQLRRLQVEKSHWSSS